MLAIAITSVGVFSIVCGLSLLALDLMRSRKAIGTIIGNKSHTGETVEMYAPIIRFETEAGQQRTFNSLCYFSSSPYPEGDPIPVRYHPTHEKLNAINKPIHRFFGIVLFIFFGGIIMWLGAVV